MRINALNRGVKRTGRMCFYRVKGSIRIEEDGLMLCIRNQEDSGTVFGERFSFFELHELRLECEVFTHDSPSMGISRNGDRWTSGHGMPF